MNAEILLFAVIGCIMFDLIINILVACDKLPKVMVYVGLFVAAVAIGVGTGYSLTHPTHYDKNKQIEVFEND